RTCPAAGREKEMSYCLCRGSFLYDGARSSGQAFGCTGFYHYRQADRSGDAGTGRPEYRYEPDDYRAGEGGAADVYGIRVGLLPEKAPAALQSSANGMGEPAGQDVPVVVFRYAGESEAGEPAGVCVDVVLPKGDGPECARL